MSTYNGVSYQDPRNINLKGSVQRGSGVLRFSQRGMSNWSTNPISSLAAGLYINSSGQLVYSYLGSTTVLGTGGGGGGTPTWEQIFAADNTFTVTPDTTFTLQGNRATGTAVMTIANVSGGSGALLAFSNLGSGNDILGTSSTWSVTKAGVATFAGFSISGTSTAIVTTGAAVWTLLDNSATALSIGASGATTMLVFDTTNGAETMKFTGKVTVTGDGSTITGASNSVASLVVVNNTATTLGASAALGVVRIASTSLTTGTILHLETTEATLNGGYYLKLWDVTAGAAVHTIGEDGATVITGAGGSDMFTIVGGDMVLSDGSIIMTDADNSATLSITNNAATSATMVVIAGSGTFTGTTTTSFMTITPSGLTTGTAIYLPVAAMTTGKALNIVANAMTTGQVILVSHTTSVIADGGSLIRATSTSIDTGGSTNGTLLDLSSTAATAATLVKIVDTALTTGIMLNLSGSTGVYTGTGYVTFTHAAATTGTMFAMTFAGLTTGKAMSITVNGLTSGNGILISSSSTDTTARGLIQLTQTGAGATGTSMLRMTQVVTSTHFRKIFTETASGITLWWGDGTTGNGALTGTAGDVLLNGGSNKPEYCTGTTVWAALV